MPLKASDGVAALQKELKQPGNYVALTPGERWLIDSGKLEPAEGVVLDCNGAEFYCPRNSVRLITRYPKVTVRGLRGIGAFTHYNYASHLLVEDSYIAHTLDGKTYMNLGRLGGATAAFMTWLDLDDANEIVDVVHRRNTVEFSYHHGFGMSLIGVQEGGGFRKIRFEECKGNHCGSGLESTGKGKTGDRDWSTTWDIPDMGDIDGLEYIGCIGTDSWQSTVHMDGSWNGHRQIQRNIRLVDCLSIDAGRRSGTVPGELYQSGYYLQRAELIRCGAIRSRKAGFLMKNQEANSLVMTDCWSRGCAYGLVIEYGGVGAKVKNFVAEQNTRRALQATAVYADIDLEIRDFQGAGRPVLLGITERLEMVDSEKAGNLKTLETRRKDAKPFTGKLRIRSNALPGDTIIDVHGPSRGVVKLDGVTYLPLGVVPPLPNPVPVGEIRVLDGSVWVRAPGSALRQLARLPEDLMHLYRHGSSYAPGVCVSGGQIVVSDGALWVGPAGGLVRQLAFLPDELQQFFRHGAVYAEVSA